MENRKNIALAVFIVLVLSGGFYWAMSVEPEPLQEDQATELRQMSYLGNSISEEKDGKKVWDLTAEKIDIDPKTKNTVLQNIKGVFYQENGDTVQLTAVHGVYDIESREVTLTDKVDAIASDGTLLRADQVQWKSNEKIFVGKGNVKITRQDTILSGDLLESDSGMKRFKMSGNAHIVKGGKQ